MSNTLNNTPSVLQLTFEAEVRNSRQFTATEGSNAGKTYYTGDSELLTPGSRWSTVRIKVRSRTPIVAGRYRLAMVQMDANKGEGVADIIIEEGK